MGVLQEVISLVISKQEFDKEDSEIAQLRKNVVAACDFIRDALEKSRAATAKVAATQTVKRIINDFNRLNKHDVPIIGMQKLFRRLYNEVVPIGPDGDAFLKVVNTYLSELEGLRTAGQERLSGDVWSDWQERISSMRKNPLTISIEEPEGVV
jgi:hypothetical protein